jgi:hypothetical protein
VRFVLRWDIRLFSTNIRALALAKYLDHLIPTSVSDMGYLRNQVVRDVDNQKFGDARHASVDIFHLIKVPMLPQLHSPLVDLRQPSSRFDHSHIFLFIPVLFSFQYNLLIHTMHRLTSLPRWHC